MRDTLRATPPSTVHRSNGDNGYTLIELLIVTLILGVLVSVVVFSVRGTTTNAAETGCDADRRQLQTATEAYFAEHGGDVLPAIGADADRHERGLAGEGLLRGPSEYYDLGADGTLTPQAGTTC